MNGDHDSRMLLQAIVESSDDAIASKTLDGIVTSWNPGAERIFGYTAAEMIGRSITTIFPPDRLHEEAEFLRRLARGEHVDHYETVRLRKDGSSVDVSVTLSPLLDAAQTVVGASKIARDITARKRAEALLHERSEFWRVTLSSIGDAVIATDAGGRVTFMNGQAQSFVGWSMVDADDRPLSGVFVIINEHTRQPAHSPVERVLAEGRVAGLANDTVLVSRDGREWPIDDSAAPILAADGRIIGVVLVFRDVTERRRAESERAQLLAAAQAARAEAERANRTKDEFLAMLAHDLRNPLAAVLNAVAALDRIGTMSPESTKARAIIRRQTEHLAGLLDDLLDITRIGRGTIDLQAKAVELRSIVERAFEAASYRFEAKQQRASADFGPEPAVVRGDPVRLRQIVANLLDNALKYTPPAGVITVAVGVERDEAVVRVRDSGIGIPSEKLSEIFELFARLKTPAAGAEGGLGIGLALVKRLTALHGGTVLALSDGEGKGSEFVLRLPRLVGVSPEPDAGAPVEHAQMSRSRILVIEDNRDLRDALAMALELEGHEVFVAGLAREGLEIAVAERPQLIVVDIGLPDADGYEVARRLREALGGDAVLIACSGYGQPEDRQRSLEAGFDAHFVKPVDPETIVSHCRAALLRRRRQSGEGSRP